MKRLLAILCLLAITLDAKSATTNFYKTSDGVNAYWSAVAAPPPPPPDTVYVWTNNAGLDGGTFSLIDAPTNVVFKPLAADDTNVVSFTWKTAVKKLASGTKIWTLNNFTNEIFGIGPKGEIWSPGSAYQFFTNSSPYPTNGEAFASYRIPHLGDANNNSLFLKTILENDTVGTIGGTAKTNSADWLVSTDTPPGSYDVQIKTTSTNARIFMVLRSDTWTDLNPAALNGTTPFILGASSNHTTGLMFELNDHDGAFSAVNIFNIDHAGQFWSKTNTFSFGTTTNSWPLTNALAGQVLASAGGAGAQMYWTAAGGGGPSPVTNITQTYITTTGVSTYTTPAGAFLLSIVCIGGGAGSGGIAAGGAGTAAASGGGGGGGYAISNIYNPVASYIVTIGTNGLGGASGANAGSNGGITRWTNLFNAGGGTGSGGVTGSATPQVGVGGNGGSGFAGIISGAGGQGQSGITLSGTVGLSGQGGTSHLGPGGSGRSSSGDGTIPINYGSGGGGALDTANLNRAGADGRQGIIIVTEYYR